MTPSSTRAKTRLVLPASMARSIPSLPSDEENVAGVNDTAGAVRQAKPERPVGFEPVEPAIALRGGEPSPDGMGPFKPGKAKRIEPFGPPAGQPVREALGKPFEQNGRLRSLGGQSLQGRHRAFHLVWLGGDIDPEADDHRIPFPFEQDTGQFGAVGDE